MMEMADRPQRSIMGVTDQVAGAQAIDATFNTSLVVCGLLK
jgi:hypothetical protein